MSNLLYNRHGTLKLADFGLAREYAEPVRPMTPKVVTLWYRPPELLLGCKLYGTSVDLWGAGCVFGELLALAPLLPGKAEPEQMGRIMRLLGRPTEAIWPGWSRLPHAAKLSVGGQSYEYNTVREKFPRISNEGVHLINAFLTYNPSWRITATDAMRHPYFGEPPLPCSIMPTFPSSLPQGDSKKKKEPREGAAAAAASGGGGERARQKQQAVVALPVAGPARPPETLGKRPRS